jgi:cholesterol transport system auxiliary component
MSFNRRFAFKSLIALVALNGLSACVTVLPEADPVTLYRFQFAPDDQFQPSDAPDKVQTMVIQNLDLPQDASGDRLLTREGHEVSYIARARWSAPAEQLFREALYEGFGSSSPRVRLSARSTTEAKYGLSLQIRRFEVEYGNKKPVVRIEADFSLIRISDRSIVSSRRVISEVEAPQNRVRDLVVAYEAATTDIILSAIGFAETAP